jgi:hypothetical protein
MRSSSPSVTAARWASLTTSLLGNPFKPSVDQGRRPHQRPSSEYRPLCSPRVTQRISVPAFPTASWSSSVVGHGHLLFQSRMKRFVIRNVTQTADLGDRPPRFSRTPKIAEIREPYSTTHELLLAWFFSLAQNATIAIIQRPSGIRPPFSLQPSLLSKFKPCLWLSQGLRNSLDALSCYFPAHVPR